jgi:hypothetical protein
MTDAWQWRTHTTPFSAVDDPAAQAAFVLEQISDKTFAISGRGFQYNREGVSPVVITSASLPGTDFASIPRYMAWLLSRYGRHTPAALVHDQLVVKNMTFADRTAADRTFRDMLDDLDVPPVLSRVMWAAVTLATHMSCSKRTRLATMVWFVLAAAGIALLAAGIATTTAWMIAVALLGPAIAAALWARQYNAGLIAGYALPVVVVPAFVSITGYWVYWLIEKATKLIRMLMPHNKGKALPDPMSYQCR